jgi:Bacterial mobilisation protein (MobC)
MARHSKEYAGERYSAHLGLQLTPRQRRNLENGAEASGMVLAEFVRSYLPLGQAAARGVCKRCQWAIGDLALEINRVGVNLNQLSHWANAEGRLPEAAALRQVLAEVKTALRRVLDLDSGTED